MRFLEHGVDIPDELIRTVNDGYAIFLCGAGVSLGAGMPLFQNLTNQVYERLGENPANEAAEAKAIARAEYDRALRSLEKRTHTPNTPSHVRTAVAELLMANNEMMTDNHLSLLHLSRDREGRTRILTTNFDTLFEHAAKKANLSVFSHVGKAIPKPGGSRDYGIFHLHGRIADTDLGLEESELVLTSADFGDVYLRDGWASQYIEDRMRINAVILVGYSAEDAALRLLLETLDADRDRFPDIKNIYAIDKEADDSSSIWKAKGIKPIEFPDYSSLYATLAEWAKYSLKPVEYGRSRINSILVGALTSTAGQETNAES
ncbi:MAG: hypothetical protein B7Y77_02520 [Bradyrhizobium sp. 35-63-5]|nr:MAG: hypothetical protein B7Y77_02520 [Bradyrhizobium sp. 35-63-5]